MRSLLPRRFTKARSRGCLFLLLIAFGYLVLLPSTSQHRTVMDGPRQAIIAVGIRHCFHITRYAQLCYRDEYMHKSSTPSQSIVIDKDLNESIGIHWVGFTSYLFIEKAPLVSARNVVSNITNDLSKIYTSNPDDDDTFITDVNVFFGSDCVDPRPGWNLLPKAQNFNFRISIKSRHNVDATITPLKVDQNGKFKIVQLADLHLGVGPNNCVDEYPPSKDGNCQADPKTIQFVSKIMDIENPDMVVFTGDQIMGDRSVQDSETSILKAVAPVITRNIPWAMIWGNHDDEGKLSRWQLSQFVATLPGSLFQFSPFDTMDNSFGVGNYLHTVWNDDNTPAISLYFLDSHKYSKSGKVYPGYDWIKESQWQYMEKLHQEQLETYNLAPTHLSMAFFHIPLPEYINIRSKANPDQQNPVVGSFKEGSTAPKYNSGGLSVLDKMNVQLTTCGHDHCNDYCLLDDSFTNKHWLCYGGGAGEGGYAGYGGTERRIRIFEFDVTNGEVHTWKRLNGSPEELFDYQILVKDGVSF